MVIRVNGTEFTKVIWDLLCGKETSINFLIRGNTLFIQSVQGVIIDTSVTIKESDVKEEIDFTIDIDQSLKLLNYKEDVYISIINNLVTLKQSHFEFQAAKSPEIRIPSEVTGEWINASSLGFTRFLGNLRYLESVAKELGLSSSSVTFHMRKGYIMYQNIAIMDTVEAPDLSMTTDVAKRLISLLAKDQSSKMKLSSDNKLMQLYVDEHKSITTTINEPDIRVVETIEEFVSKMKPVSKFDMTRYAPSIEIICKAYSKLLIEVYFLESGLGLSVSRGKSRYFVGDNGLPVMSIKISVGQLYAINKLFGSEPNVIVSRGDNKICLSSTSSPRKLIIPGVIY